MNWNLARKKINDRWRSVTVYGASIAAYVLFIVAMFNTFKNIEGVQEFLTESYPKDIMKFFGAETFDITSINNFMVIQFLSMMWIIICAVLVISYSRNMIAGELDDGTLELLLAQPVERWQVLLTEGTVLLGIIITLTLTTILSVFVFGGIFGVEITYSGYLAFLPLGCALLLAIAGYSVFFSALSREPRRAAMAAAGLTVFFYVLNFGANYSSVVEKINYISIFRYYTPLDVLETGTVPVGDILILLAFAIVGFGLAILVFRKKDIT